MHVKGTSRPRPTHIENILMNAEQRTATTSAETIAGIVRLLGDTDPAGHGYAGAYKYSLLCK